MKKCLLFLLAVLWAALAGWASAQAEALCGPWTYELTAEGLVITGYSGDEADVVIPDELDGYGVSVIGRRAFMDHHEIHTLVIPEGISAIRAEAFYGCTGLSRIEYNARNCVVPEVWTYSDSKGAGVFSGAGSTSTRGLRVVFGDRVRKVPDYLFDTASIDEDGHGNHPYAYVTEVILSDSVKEIGSCTFRSCQSLEEVSFGAGLQAIGDSAFRHCVALEELAFDDALLTLGKSAFRDDAALERVEWGAGLETIGDSAFRNCPSLKTLAFVCPLTTVGARAFADCVRLEALSLPESVTHIEAEAFRGCIKLAELDVNCANLTVPEVWTYSDSKGAGVFSGAGSASTRGLRVAFGDAVRKVPDYLFDTASIDEDGHGNCPFAYVTEVILSDSVKEIGDCAFRSCQSLEEVSFGAGLQAIGDCAFRHCVALEELAFDDALLTLGKGAFRDDMALERVEWGAGLETIGDSAFRNCPSLKTLAFVCPLTTVGARAFADCVGLEALSLPESVTHIEAEAFRGCIKLAELDVNCANLTVPEVWTYSDSKGAGVFSGAGSASTRGLRVAFGDAVGRVPDYLFDTASIDQDGHGKCPFAYVTEVILSDSVKEIGSCAFRSCQSLARVSFDGPDAAFGDHVFDNCIASGFHIECPPGGSLEQYALEAGLAWEAVDRP